MNTIDIFQKLSDNDFAEDKQLAKSLRKEVLLPSLEKSNKVEINFDKVSIATQSFIHALIAETLQIHGEKALDYIVFANCNNTVKGMIETVVQYTLEASDPENSHDTNAKSSPVSPLLST